MTSDHGVSFLLDEEGGCVSAEQLAVRYASRRTVAEAIADAKAGRLVAYRRPSGEYAIPIWQFDADGCLLPGVEAALAMIRADASHYSDLFPFTFFLQADGRSDNGCFTPLQAMRHGDVDRVMNSLRSLIFG